jgi:hypothetical protein
MLMSRSSVANAVLILKFAHVLCQHQYRFLFHITQVSRPYQTLYGGLETRLGNILNQLSHVDSSSLVTAHPMVG